MSAKVRTTDRGAAALLKQFYGAHAPKIDVGILAGKAEQIHESGEQAKEGTQARPVTIVDVATWNEFGTDTIPERSFIRGWLTIYAEPSKQLVVKLLQSVVRGKRKLADVPELLGATFVGQMQKRMAEGIPPANAPVTVERKGSSKPLIDTGQLRSSITFRVRLAQGDT